MDNNKNNNHIMDISKLFRPTEQFFPRKQATDKRIAKLLADNPWTQLLDRDRIMTYVIQTLMHPGLQRPSRPGIGKVVRILKDEWEAMDVYKLLTAMYETRGRNAEKFRISLSDYETLKQTYLTEQGIQRRMGLGYPFDDDGQVRRLTHLSVASNDRLPDRIENLDMLSSLRIFAAAPINAVSINAEQEQERLVPCRLFFEEPEPSPAEPEAPAEPRNIQHLLRASLRCPLLETINIKCRCVNPFPSTGGIVDFPHLKNLSIAGCTWGGVRFPQSLVSLNIKECTCDNPFPSTGGIVDFPDLKKLSIAGCTWDGVRFPQSLVSLDIKECTLTAVVLPESLERLSIRESQLLESPGVLFPHSLVSLDVEDITLTAVVPPENLKRLTIQNFKLIESPAFIESLQNMESLEKFTVWDMETWRHLGSPSNVTDLPICHAVAMELASEGKILPRIKYLGMPMSDAWAVDGTFAGQTVAQVFPNLTKLEIMCAESLVDLKSLECFTHLRSICIDEGTVIASSAVCLPHLERLSFCTDTKFSCGIFGDLDLPNLRYLELKPWSDVQDGELELEGFDDETMLTFFDKSKKLCRSDFSPSFFRENEAIVEQLESICARNRITLGLEMAESRVLGSAAVETSLWPLVLEHSPKALFIPHPGGVPARNRFFKPAKQQDAIFQILRERGAKEIFAEL